MYQNNFYYFFKKLLVGVLPNVVALLEFSSLNSFSTSLIETFFE